MRTDEKAGTGELSDEIARIETIINSPKMREMRKRIRGAGAIRPRNAATILIVDGKAGNERILMGTRNRSLTFMPGALVFPGGAVDRADNLVPSADTLDPETERKIVANMRGPSTGRRARALGMAALRELSEESGLLIGRRGDAEIRHPDWEPFARHGIIPAIGGLRLLARAITPPGPPRRFDTWFFVARAEEIAHEPEGGFEPSGELEELQWITPEAAIGGDTREITRVMLVELMNRMKRDPALDPSYPAPFYHAVRNRFHKEVM